MAKDNIERLFLLEILVDNVYIDTSELNLDPKTLSSLKQTCVRFQFLNYPPLEICEEDFTPTKGKYDADEVSFKSGKSCLFAVRGQHPAALAPPFNMNVTVMRLMSNKKSCTIGTACIQLGECFATLVNCCKVCPSTPTTKTIKDTYPLADDRNCEIGKITVFIRMSCFGKLIITQFQLGGLENKSFLFRAESESVSKKEEESKPGAEKVIIPTSQKQPISNVETFCEQIGGPPVPPPPRKPCSGFGGQQMQGGLPMMPGQPMMQGPPIMPPPFMGMGGMPNMMGGMPPMMGLPGMMPGPNFGGGGMPGFQLMPVRNVGASVSTEAEVSSDYKELSASVNGHELTIRILRKPKKFKETRVLSGSESSINTKVDRREIHEKLKQAFCDCDVPFPKELEMKKQKNKYDKKEPCPLLTGRTGAGRRLSQQKVAPFPLVLPQIGNNGDEASNGPEYVSVKENFIVKLGNCPKICYKVPQPHPLPPNPCITDRDTTYEQKDTDLAMKLYQEYLSAAKKDKGKGKGKDKGKGKGKGKGKKGKKGKKK